MPQILYVKQKEGGQRAVKIIRSWFDASGQAIYLHADGHYGYKDGSPCRSVGEFGIIGDKIQRELAQAWWQRTGKTLSEGFYAALEEAQREEAGDFRSAAAMDNTALDAILYVRRPAGRKKGGAVSAAHAWMEWFDRRPDWWGQAKKVEFLDYAYEIAGQDYVPAVSDATATPVMPRPAPVESLADDGWPAAETTTFPVETQGD